MYTCLTSPRRQDSFYRRSGHTEPAWAPAAEGSTGRTCTWRSSHHQRGRIALSSCPRPGVNINTRTTRAVPWRERFVILTSRSPTGRDVQPESETTIRNEFRNIQNRKRQYKGKTWRPVTSPLAALTVVSEKSVCQPAELITLHKGRHQNIAMLFLGKEISQAAFRTAHDLIRTCIVSTSNIDRRSVHFTHRCGC